MASLPAPLQNPALRRAVTVPAVALGAAGLAGSAALWAPLAAGYDLLGGRSRTPTLRALALALGWSAIETAGVAASATLWAVGHGEDQDAHYALQRWWAGRLVELVHGTAGLTFEVEGIDVLRPGPVVMCARHTSLVDALLPVWLLGRVGMRPRYVLKDGLQLDPCLDIVGNRLPNHFVDRDPGESSEELAALEQLSRGVGRQDAVVIFPEGGLVTEASRARAVRRIADRHPMRLQHTRGLRVLAPVRPGGTAALLRGAPDADLVFVTHTGLESLRRLVDALRGIPLDRPVQVRLRRVRRRGIPENHGFVPWLDAQWARCDEELVASGR